MTEKVQTYEEAIKKTIAFWVEKSFRTKMNQDNGDKSERFGVGFLLANMVAMEAQKIKP